MVIKVLARFICVTCCKYNRNRLNIKIYISALVVCLALGLVKFCESVCLLVLSCYLYLGYKPIIRYIYIMIKILPSVSEHTRQLVKLALPVVMALLLQITYNTVDLYWVGRISSDAVAAVGSAGFFMSLGISICSIVSMGAMVKISQAVGAKDYLMQRRYAAAAIILALIIGGSYVFSLILFPDKLISIFDIPNENVNSMAASYLRILGFGAILSYLNITLTAILNAHGKTKLSFKAVLYGNIVNIILDPIFIILLDMGVEGAAWATVTAWSSSFIYYYTIIYRKRLVAIEFEGLSRRVYSMILRVGSASAAQRILFTVIAIAIGKVTASFGADAIAAQKVGLQIESLTFMVVGGMQQAISIMVGQKYGAAKYDDIRHMYRSALKVALSVAAVSTTLFMLLPTQLVSIFVDDPATIETGRYYLIVVGISQIFMAAEMITGGAFNGLGLTHYSATISIIFTSMRIPLAIALSATSLGVVGIWWSISITSIIKGIVSVIIYRMKAKKLVNKV